MAVFSTQRVSGTTAPFGSVADPVKVRESSPEAVHDAVVRSSVESAWLYRLLYVGRLALVGWIRWLPGIRRRETTVKAAVPAEVVLVIVTRPELSVSAAIVTVWPAETVATVAPEKMPVLTSNVPLEHDTVMRYREFAANPVHCT